MHWCDRKGLIKSLRIMEKQMTAVWKPSGAECKWLRGVNTCVKYTRSVLYEKVLKVFEMYSKFQLKSLCIWKGQKQLMSKVEFEGLPSSHGLQGSNHTQVLFGCFCCLNLRIFIFAALLPSILWEGDCQLTSSGCKNKGCLLSLNHAMMTASSKPKKFC